MKNLSFRLLRGDRLGVVGPNGVGKTTLLKLFTGKLAPDSGEATFGARLAAVTLDQFRAELPPTTTVVEALTGGGSDYHRDRRRAQARHWLHEGLPVRAGAGAHADRRSFRAASAAG